VRWKIASFVTLQTEAGEDLGRKFEYYRISDSVKVDSASYVDTKLTISFWATLSNELGVTLKGLLPNYLSHRRPQRTLKQSGAIPPLRFLSLSRVVQNQTGDDAAKGRRILTPLDEWFELADRCLVHTDVAIVRIVQCRCWPPPRIAAIAADLWQGQRIAKMAAQEPQQAKQSN
jgi:hypothetical protein